MKVLLFCLLVVLAISAECDAVKTVIVALKSAANKQYVTAPNYGAGSLVASSKLLGTEQRFMMKFYANNIVSFRALVNGKLVCAENAGDNSLIANRDVLGPW